MEAYLGIDIGSVTTKVAALNRDDELITSLYLPTQGKPIETVQQGLRQVKEQLPDDISICGVATTGSARYLAGVIVGADLVKNEITSHAVAALRHIPQVKTIIEIGGQALSSQAPVSIAGRCTVFAESDMIHKQQMGNKLEDIIYGLCRALVR